MKLPRTVAGVALLVALASTPVRGEPAAGPRPLEDYVADVGALLGPRSDERAARRALVVVRYGLRRYPYAEPLHRLEGIAAYRLGDLARSRRAFGKAIRIAPDVAFNHLKLASLELCGARRPDAAEAALRVLFERRPEDDASRELAAELYSRCGDPDAAVSLWLDLVTRVPEQAWLYRFKAGQIYHRAGRHATALRLLERALAEGPPGRAELPAQVAATLARLGRSADAARRYREALERGPPPALASRLREELAGL